MYVDVAQYDYPPEYPVTVVCGGIDGAPQGADILDRIYAGVVAYRGSKSCYNVSTGNMPASPGEDDLTGWDWQVSKHVLPAVCMPLVSFFWELLKIIINN